jgi:hypothetical protein
LPCSAAQCFIDVHRASTASTSCRLRTAVRVEECDRVFVRRGRGGRSGIRTRFLRPNAHRFFALCDREHLPVAGHALERVDPATLELDSRAGNEVLDRSRGEHLTRPG